MIDDLFPGFSKRRVDLPGSSISCVVGGSGPPVLLLHGYPQTYAAWHKIAPRLASRFTVVAPDLRGYGESVALGDPAHDTYSKRSLARDQRALMAQLGHTRFAIVGHDRGARVAYRLALDFPAAVDALVALSVVPTVDAWDGVNATFAMKAYHWFLLAQPDGLPERLIGADPDFFIDRTLSTMADGRSVYDREALRRYQAAFQSSAVRHAICEDYRCAANLDAAADKEDIRTGRQILCPTLVLWAARPLPDPTRHPLALWRPWVADRLEGVAIADVSHMLPEEAPDAVLDALLPFLTDAPAARHLLAFPDPIAAAERVDVV